MIVDYRAYFTAYALLALAWLATIPLMQREGPRFASLWMMGTASAFCLLGFANFVDWLWS